jgi:hypothetical protein
VILRVLALPLLAFLLGCAPFRELPAWEKPPPPARDAPVVDAARLHRAELANGMHVLVLEDHRLPRIEVGVVVRRGAGIVAPGRAGLAIGTPSNWQPWSTISALPSTSRRAGTR